MAFQNNKNFSHVHVLDQLRVDEHISITCNACEEHIASTELFRGCPSCNFHLHFQCLNAPLYLQHPSHTSHHLTLLASPTYSSRSFGCVACGLHGNGSWYNCRACDFNIHLRCANLPMSLFIKEHHHALRLHLTSPYKDGNAGFQCDLCHGMKENEHWSYYCQGCDFGTHVGCAMKFKETTNYTGTHSSTINEEIEKLEAIARAEADAARYRRLDEARAEAEAAMYRRLDETMAKFNTI